MWCYYFQFFLLLKYFFLFKIIFSPVFFKYSHEEKENQESQNSLIKPLLVIRNEMLISCGRCLLSLLSLMMKAMMLTAVQPSRTFCKAFHKREKIRCQTARDKQIGAVSVCVYRVYLRVKPQIYQGRAIQLSFLPSGSHWFLPDTNLKKMNTVSSPYPQQNIFTHTYTQITCYLWVLRRYH